MAASTEIGSAYLSLVASAKGIKQQIIGEIANDMQAVGRESGQQLSDSAEKTSGTRFAAMGKFLGGLVLTGVVAAAAGIGAAIGDAMESQDAKAKMTAQLGVSAEESKRFGKLAGDVYAGAYGDSLPQVTEAMVSVFRNIGEGSDEWTKKTTENILSVSKAFDQDIGATSRAVGKMLKTGLAKDSEEALDILTKGLQGGADEAGDLLDSFSEYSTMFRDLGLDGKQAMGLISQGLAGGARDADTVSDALKEFAIRAQDASTTSAKGFEAIGLNAKDMTAAVAEGGPRAADALAKVLDGLRNLQDPAERNAAAVALFGTKAEDLGDALFDLDLDTTAQHLGDVQGAAQGVNDTLSDTASSKIDGWKRTIQQNVSNFINEEVLPAIAGFVEKIKLSGVLEDMQETGRKIGEFWQKIKDDAASWVEEHRGKLEEIKTQVRDLWNNIQGIYRDGVDLVREIWDLGGQQWMSAVANGVGGVIEIVTGLIERVRGMFMIAKGILTGDWDTIWEGIKLSTDGALKTLGGIIDLSLGNIVTWMGGDWDEMKRVAGAKWGELVQAVRNHLQSMSNAVDILSDMPWRAAAWFENMKQSVVQKGQELLNWVRGLPREIVNAVFGSNLGGMLWDAGASIMRGFLDGLKAKFEEVKTFLSVVTSVIPQLKGPPSRDATLLTKNGQLIMQSLLKGLQQGESAVYSQLSGMTNAIAGTGAGVTFGAGGSLASDALAGAGGTTINVYGSEGQSSESIAEHVITKQQLLRRI